MSHNKYHAAPTCVDGIKFASKLESKRYKVLKEREQAYKIKDLELQPVFILQDGFRDRAGKAIRAIKYVADFRYKTECGDVVVEDVKGVVTDVFKIKWKLLLYKYKSGIKFVIVKDINAI